MSWELGRPGGGGGGAAHMTPRPSAVFLNTFRCLTGSAGPDIIILQRSSAPKQSSDDQAPAAGAFSLKARRWRRHCCSASARELRRRALLVQ